MQVKELVKQVMDQLPDDVGLDQVMYALYVAFKFDQGLQAHYGGCFVTQEEIERQFLT